MSSTLLASLARSIGFILLAGALPACSCDPNSGQGDGGRYGDGFDPNGDGGAGDGGSNACGDDDPSCTANCIGPTCSPSVMFPLPTDNPPPDGVGADGVNRNPAGYLVLDSSKASFDFLWIANSGEYDIGTISKIDSKARSAIPAGAVNGAYREVARYVTVTCKSDPNPASWGSAPATLGVTATGTCDGTVGCCSNAPAGQRTAVQLVRNLPSRTAVDYNGDVWVGNRAHGAAPNQQSVTKIANRNNSINDTECIDRNKNGKIDSSYDANGDGIINTDCNKDGKPDDFATVCTAGVQKEFFGLDDECVLFTTTTGAAGGVGRPLALGPGSAGDAGPSDAWAGLYESNSATGKTVTFYRIDGTTGLIKGSVKIADKNGIASRPYGAVIDQFGILWAPNIDNNALFYFDTNNTTNQGMLQEPTSTDGFYGIAIDGYADPVKGLVQQVWMGRCCKAVAGGFRYRPVRGQGFAALGNGTWAEIQFTGIPAPNASNGRGVGVDNRTPTSYAWFGLDGLGGVGRVPTNIADGVTMLGAATFGTNGGSGTIGTGVAADLDIWAVNNGTNSATHFRVDAAGTVTTPQAGDQVRLDDSVVNIAHTAQAPYTYSDFTGFGLRNFTNPRGTYTFRQQGCGAGKTKWLKVSWDADTPPATKIVLRARSADDISGLANATFYGDYTTSPADLSQSPGPLVPNPSGYLEVQFVLSTMDKSLTPALKSFTILSECVNSLN